MVISQDIVNQIIEQEDAGKSKVVFLALSTFRIEEDDEINVSTLTYDGNEIGKYYHQMEPVLLLLKTLKTIPDNIVVLCTDATRKPKRFVIEGKEYTESEEEYFKNRIIDLFGRDIMIPVYEEDTVVQTIKCIIHKLRELNKTENGINLTIDIHGGLRNTQMLVQSIISLLRFENMIPKSIYTVKYDTGRKAGEILPAYDIHQFVIGMGEFLSYGRSNSLMEYYKRSDNTLSTLIGNISDAIQLCNIKLFDESIKEMKKYVDNYHETGDFGDLFIDVIKSSYGDLMDERGRNKVINKVRWCVDNDYIQQSLTIIESQMPQEFLQRNIIRYKYDDPDTRKVHLYRNNRGEIPTDIVGDIPLSYALNHSKQDWNTPINHALIPWIRENCCDSRNLRNGRKSYTDRISISGDDINKYLDLEISDDCLAKECIIDNVDDNENVILLSFEPNERLNDLQRKDLTRLFMLHLVLKDQRNVSNHASSTNRASVREVKTAIYAYIELTERTCKALEK